MPLLDDLTWTTREEVGARLLPYLRETRPPAIGEARLPVYPTRERVAELLCLVATPEFRDPLLQVALDLEEECEVRRQAVLGLRGMEVALSGEQLRLLLADPQLLDETSGVSAADVLELVRTPEAEAVARTYFLALDVEGRATVLPWLLPTGTEGGTAFSEWLYQHWLEHDRHAFAADDAASEANLQIIRFTLARAASRRVLQELWRAAVGEARRGLLEELYEDHGEGSRMWTFPDPLTATETEELGQALAMPTADLVEHYGHRDLVDRLQRALVQAEQHREAQWRARQIGSSSDIHWEALLMWHWLALQTDEELATYVLREGLSRDRKWWVMEALWRRSRSAAAAPLTAALRAGDHSLSRLFIHWVARTPVPEDEEFLREAFRADQRPEYRYHGLCGLDHLAGVAQDWVEALPELAHDPRFDPRLRLRAWGALARRGDSAALRVLAAHATETADLRVRAEALAILAEVASATAWPLLAEAICCSGPVYDLHEGRRDFSPLAEEAALALTRIGSPEARTLLLRAYLRARTHGLMAVLDEYLTAVLASPPGEASPPPNPIGGWRKEVAWRWT